MSSKVSHMLNQNLSAAWTNYGAGMGRLTMSSGRPMRDEAAAAGVNEAGHRQSFAPSTARSQQQHNPQPKPRPQPQATGWELMEGESMFAFRN